MKIVYLYSNRPIPPDVEEIWPFLISVGDTYEAIDQGPRLAGISGRGPNDDIDRALLDVMLREGLLRQELYDEITGPGDPEQHGYYIQTWGPWKGPGTGAPATGLPTPPVHPDIEVINRHRASIGGDPIDPSAGWSSEELHEMAENIRTKGTEHNPRQDQLKRKLMI